MEDTQDTPEPRDHMREVFGCSDGWEETRLEREGVLSELHTQFTDVKREEDLQQMIDDGDAVMHTLLADERYGVGKPLSCLTDGQHARLLAKILARVVLRAISFEAECISASLQEEFVPRKMAPEEIIMTLIGVLQNQGSEAIMSRARAKLEEKLSERNHEPSQVDGWLEDAWRLPSPTGGSDD